MYSGQTITDGSVVWKVKDLRDVATTVEAGLMSAADKIKLNGIATGANAYSLPNASTSTKGGLIVGAGLAANGATVSVAAASTGTIGGVKIGSGISTGAGGVISIPSATSVSAGLMTTDQVTKLNGIATNANNYSLPNATTSTKGGIIVGSGLVANGATVSVAAASTGTIGGIKLGSSGFLKYDGTWATPTNTTYNVATSSANGLMSASDKSKLDGITAALQYKGTVESYSKLPTTGLVTGYVYNITNAGGTDANGVAIKAGDNVAYNGSGWDVLSGTVDLSNYVTKDGSKVLSTNDFTTAYKNKLDGIASGANAYSLPNASTTTKGGLIVGAGLAANGATVSVAAASTGTIGGVKLGGGTANFYRADGNWAAPPNTTYPAMTGASSSAAGATGLVPAPAAGKQTSFLRGDGTWVIPTNTTYSVFTSGTATINGTLVPSIAANTSGKYLQSNGTWATPTNTTYPAASGSAAGLMSAAHYTKLEGIATNANNYSLPNATTSTKGGIIVGSGLVANGATVSVGAASTSKIGGITLGGGTTNFFRADGQWAAPPGVTQLASSSANGLMSKDDKVLLSTIYDDVLGVGTLSSSSYVSYNYDAKSHSPVSLLTSSQYSWLEKVDSVSSGSTTTATNAGTYNIMYKPKDGYHWRGLTGTASVASQAYKWTINRIADTITLSSGTDPVILVGSGDTKTVTVSAGSTGAISISPTSNSYFTSSISGKIITFTFASAPSDGTMSSTNVTITSAAGGNYNASTKTLQVKTTVVQSNLIDNVNAISNVKTAVANGVAPNTWVPGDIIGPVTMNGTLSGSNDCVLNNYKAYFFVLGFDHNYEKESKVTENNVDYYYHTMTLQFGVYTNSDGSYNADYHVAFCDSKYGQYNFSDANYFRHHTTNTNAQGWAGTSTQALYTETPSAQGSDLRKISCPRFYNALPENWRNAICEITKYTDNTGGGSDTASYVTASTEVIFLLSEYEVFGARSYANSAEQNYQKQYNYFTYGGKAVADTAKMWKYNDISTWLGGGDEQGWWFRSRNIGGYHTSTFIGSYSGAPESWAMSDMGFAPAFCIGDKTKRYTAANFVANQYSGIHS